MQVGEAARQLEQGAPTSHDAFILQRTRSSVSLARLRPPLRCSRRLFSASEAIAHLPHAVAVLLRGSCSLLARSMQLLPLVLKRPLPANGLCCA